MRKVLFCAAVLFFALAVAAFAGRAEIEEALNSYEAIVVEAETLAEMPLVNTDDFAVVDEKATAAGEAIAAVTEDKEWIIDDAKRAAALRARFNQAIATVAQKLLKF